jgi:hypothetical protein
MEDSLERPMNRGIEEILAGAILMDNRSAQN